MDYFFKRKKKLCVAHKLTSSAESVNAFLFKTLKLNYRAFLGSSCAICLMSNMKCKWR